MTLFVLFELVLISLCLIILAFFTLGRFPAMLALLFFVFFVFSYKMFSVGTQTLHTGIAPSGPTFYTFSVVVLLLGVGCLFSRRRDALVLAFLPLLGFLGFSMKFVWVGSSEQWAGVLAIFVAVVAWSVGLFLGRDFDRDGSSGKQLASIVAMAALVEFTVSLLQLGGIQLYPVDIATAELVIGRTNGTFNHPGTLGKALLILVVLALPLTRSSAASVKRLAYLSLIATFIPLIFSGSRANLFGIMAMLGVWALLMPRERRVGGRVAFFALASLVAVSSIGILSARFAEDPAGEVRRHLNTVALAQIALRPFTGSGPNSYVSAASPSDALTAQGWPVHNIFLLAGAELGVIGAVLLFMPVLQVFLRSWQLRRTNSLAGDFARSLLSFLPAFLVIGLTGWGMLDREILPFWFFVMGFCMSQFPKRGALRKDANKWQQRPLEQTFGMRHVSPGALPTEVPSLPERPGHVKALNAL
jgi:O-antigen ligase